MSVTLSDDLWAKIYGILRDTVWKVNDVYYSVLSISRASFNVTGMTFPLTSDYVRQHPKWFIKDHPDLDPPMIDWTDFNLWEFKHYPKIFNWSNYNNPWSITSTSIWDPEQERRREEARIHRMKRLQRWTRKRIRPFQ